MILEWLPDKEGFIASDGKRLCRIRPAITPGFWNAEIDGFHIWRGRGVYAWEGKEEAKAACERAIAAKPGRRARGTVCLKSYPAAEAIARLDAYRATLPPHEGKVCSRSRAVETLLMGLPPVSPAGDGP